MVEPAAEQVAVAQCVDQFVDGLRASRQRAVDAFMGQQHAAFQPELGAKRPQRLAQIAEIRQRGELIEGGDLVGHVGGLSGGRRRQAERLRRLVGRIEGYASQALPSTG